MVFTIVCFLSLSHKSFNSSSDTTRDLLQQSKVQSQCMSKAWMQCFCLMYFKRLMITYEKLPDCTTDLPWGQWIQSSIVLIMFHFTHKMPFSEKTKSWIAIRENVLLLELAEINPIEFLLWSQECFKHKHDIFRI